MKSILISIQPKWVAKILNGEKTIEIRKTMPKCVLPIDVYIYCTKNGNKLAMFDKQDISKFIDIANGKVVAKFTLNKVDDITYIKEHGMFTYYNNIPYKACLTDDELIKYLNHKKGYAWHISNLVIFDKPKKLSEFETTKQQLVYIGQEQPILQNITLTKAPQSWCYIEKE